MTTHQLYACLGAALLDYAMYLVFCWAVYLHRADPEALAEAGRVGRFRQFILGLPSRGEGNEPPPAPTGSC